MFSSSPALSRRLPPTEKADLLEAAGHYESTAAGCREHSARLLEAAAAYDERAADYRKRAALLDATD